MKKESYHRTRAIFAVVVSFMMTISMVFGSGLYLAPAHAAPAASGAAIDETNHTITMRYDDYLDVSSLGTIGDDAITDEVVTSKKVQEKVTNNNSSVLKAYEFASETNDEPDAHAIESVDEGSTLHAVGTGTAKVTIGGQVYDVTVSPAPISMLAMLGQSNANGFYGTKDTNLVCERGTAYQTNPHESLSVSNAHAYIPQSLTGETSRIGMSGNTTACTDSANAYGGNSIDALTSAGNGVLGWQSALAKEWIDETGEKVWIVNAAHSGSTISTWIPGGTNYNEAVDLIYLAQHLLKTEIAAGHYTLSHFGYFWLHGESASASTAVSYIDSFTQMHEGLKEELTTDMSGSGSGTLEFGGIILCRPTSGTSWTGYRHGTWDDELPDDVEYENSFKHLEMSGARVAQYYMGNSSDDTYKDVYLVCNVQD